MKDLPPAEIWELKILAAKLVVGPIVSEDLVVFADRLATRGFEDPEIIEILSEPYQELAELAPHLRRWAERYGVAPADPDAAGFTLAAALAKRFLTGTCSVDELWNGMLHLWCYADCDFEAGGFYDLPEYRSAGVFKMSDEEMNSILRKLAEELIECYERDDLDAWNTAASGDTSELWLKSKGVHAPTKTR